MLTRSHETNTSTWEVVVDVSTGGKGRDRPILRSLAGRLTRDAQVPSPRTAGSLLDYLDHIARSGGENSDEARTGSVGGEETMRSRQLHATCLRWWSWQSDHLPHSA